MKRNLLNRLFFLSIALLAVATLSGCGCGPLSEQDVGVSKWQPQTAKARLSNADTATDECLATVVRQCTDDMASACGDRSHSHTVFRDRVTGDRISDARISRLCAAPQSGPESACALGVVPRDTIDECMAGKGFKNVEITKKACYLNFG